MKQKILRGHKRDTTKSGNARRLRRAGKIPGTIYGRNMEPVNAIFDSLELTKLVSRDTAMITVDLDGEEMKGIIRDVQYHPVTDAVIHIDILGVDVTQEVRVTVPVALHGHPASVKAGGILEHVTRELDIECLPTDIPEHISVDVSHLEMHKSIHVGDLVLERIKVLTPPDTVVAMVVPPRVEVEAAPAVAEEGAEEEGAGEKEDSEDKE